jgi:hypothetical protein
LILGFCKTVMLLKAIVHQQSITSAEPSVLELYVDRELLHRGAMEHAVDKISRLFHPSASLSRIGRTA